jgi:hypothetical protein
MDSKRKGSQILKNNPQGSRLRGRYKKDGGTEYKHTLINEELRIERRGKKQLTGRILVVTDGVHILFHFNIVL